jgi:predicted TIM-barrel fold metal-dependent hydrolase
MSSTEDDMASLRVISADSHVIEPGDLWTQRLGKAFQDRAPRVGLNPIGAGYWLTAPGINPFPLGPNIATGKSGTELSELLERGYEVARPSGWDPVERIKDQDVDGVEAEVLYTTLGMPLFALPDVELQRACFAVYNDWLADFCSHSPRRLIGSALIALHDVKDAVAELNRCRKMGLRSAMISAAAPDDRPYSSRDYDAFWNAAAELEMPLSLHIITARGQSAGVISADIAARAEPGALGMLYLSRYMFYPADIQVSLFTLVVGGVLERFAKLRIVSAESDIGWLPHFIFRLDHGYEKFSAVKMTRLQMKPSDYLKRQMYATFQDDPIGAFAHHFFGDDNYMWASDFPHSDSTWPHSHEVIGRDFAGVPEDVTRKIVFENASRLYKIN